jgi:hypothetical protein
MRYVYLLRGEAFTDQRYMGINAQVQIRAISAGDLRPILQ